MDMQKAATYLVEPSGFRFARKKDMQDCIEPIICVDWSLRHYFPGAIVLSSKVAW
jgi:hypothetical protein